MNQFIQYHNQLKIKKTNIMKTKIIQTLLHFLLKHYSKRFILVQVNNKVEFESENDITMISNIKERGLIRILLVRVKNKL